MGGRSAHKETTPSLIWASPVKKNTDLLRNVIGVSEQQLESILWNAAAQFNGDV